MSASLSFEDLCSDEWEDILKLSPHNDNEMLHRVHVSLHLKNLSHEHDLKHNTVLTEENAYASQSLPRLRILDISAKHSVK